MKWDFDAMMEGLKHGDTKRLNFSLDLQDTIESAYTTISTKALDKSPDATFEALNGNSLVYDGRLVVDTNFCTNDKAIYAAGVITKFSRRYRSKVAMGSVSGRECGAKLAAALTCEA